MAASEGEDGPSPRFWQHSFEYEGKVYIRGGRTSDFEEERGQLETIIECYDPIHKTWQQIETKGTPHPGLTQAACVYVDGIFYIYGSCERKVLSQLDLNTPMVWSRLWEGSEKDDGKVPMSKAAGGMIYLKGGYLGLFGGYAHPTGTLQPGSEWTPNPYEKEKGWTNEFHLFNINERVWLTPVILGQRPPPCSDFALNGITGTMAVLFGGYQHNGLQEQLYTIKFDPTSLEVTFTLKEETKPWPEGRECHASCCIGLGTDHPQMLISGGKNMRDIALKFDMWMLDVKSFTWKKVKLPPGTKRSPRYAHSMTTVITYPGLESVVIFGGTPAEFTGKWTTPEFPKLTEMFIYNFGNHASEWTLLEEEKLVISPVPELTLYVMDDRFSMKSLFSLEKAHGIPLLSGLTEQFKSFQLELEDNQPDTISAISKWLRRSSSRKAKEPTWQNLVSVLRHIDLGYLANQVESFIKQSADEAIEHLISTNHDLGHDLSTSCDKTLETGGSLRKKTHHFVKRTAYAMDMVKWKYEKDIKRLTEELKRMEVEDDVVEADEPREVATSAPDVELLQKVKDLEQQLSKLEEHSDSTIKLLKKENERLKKQQSSTMSESLPWTVSVKHKVKDEVEMETGDVGPIASTVSPVSSGGAFQLEGVDVCGETSLVVTNSAQVFEWKGYGLKLSIPDGSLPKDYDFCEIKIIASLSGQYKFPSDCQLVSAIFWLRCEPICKFEKPITVEMEHCAHLDSASNLCFVRAQCNQPHPYTFSKIGGKFDGDKHVGTVDLKGFSGLAASTSDSSRREYCARIFHFNQTIGENSSYEIDFVVTWNIAAKLTAVKKEYEGKNAILGLEQVIEFDSDLITIDVPLEGVIKEGWKIQPLARPVVVKETVDRYDEGTVIPKCQFSAKFAHHDRDFVPPLEHQAKLLGARFPNDVITFNITPPRKRALLLESGVAPSVKRPKNETYLYPSGRNIHLLKWKNAEGKTERFQIVSQISYKWEKMGSLLGIPRSQLHCWSKECGTGEQCCVAVLHHWLDNPTDDYPATWDGLCELLEDCELTNVANELRRIITILQNLT